MAYDVIFFDEARQDIKEAKGWYKKQQNGLQKKFADAIRKTVLRLQNNPSAFSIRYKNIRIAHADIFPFRVHFYFDPKSKQIGIIGIIHDSRDEGIISKV